MPFKGYDCAFPDPGAYEKMDCVVCGADMNVTRNVNGPRSMVESMGGSKTLHDKFTCPHTDEDWHKQALNIHRKAEETPSKKIEEILLAEKAEIVASKKATKKTSYWW